MGAKNTKPRGTIAQDTQSRAEMIPDATNLGPQFCKSCWFERHGLIRCHNHYLCLSCLTLLMTVSERCPICKFPLPDKIQLKTAPSAPPAELPPPYSPA
nr:Z protein [Berega mammarenavirus]